MCGKAPRAGQTTSPDADFAETTVRTGAMLDGGRGTGDGWTGVYAQDGAAFEVYGGTRFTQLYCKPYIYYI